MATLKDHQQAMVDLLASGSGIPASASRLAHAMHDVLGMLNTELIEYYKRREAADAVVSAHADRLDATTPGLNDKALAADVEACRVKLTGAGAGPKVTPAEHRVKELENTVKQLRASNAILKEQRDNLGRQLAEMHLPEQAGCRKDDTQACEHEWDGDFYGGYARGCVKCRVIQ